MFSYVFVTVCSKIPQTNDIEGVINPYDNNQDLFCKYILIVVPVSEVSATNEHEDIKNKTYVRGI